ncbi:MAG: hypothetical protein AB7U98_12165 [Candidatus Nitrosocosmicus sp.]
MYKNNKIHQKITKSNGNDKLTLPVGPLVTFMLITRLFSVSTGMNNSFATTNDTKQVSDISKSQNSKSELLNDKTIQSDDRSNEGKTVTLCCFGDNCRKVDFLAVYSGGIKYECSEDESTRTSHWYRVD